MSSHMVINCLLFNLLLTCAPAYSDIKFNYSISNPDLPPFGCPFYAYCRPNKRVINDNGVLECEQCVCPNGTRYSGNSCAIASDPCQAKPCDNDPNSRTACYATESGYECRCPVGQAGPKCQFNRAAKLCWPDPCSSRGTCQENLSDKTYVCKCNDNFFGSQCQYERKECDITCQNGGKCRQDAKFDMFLCDCQNGFYGQLCDTKDTVCVDNPTACGSKNGLGICMPSGESNGNYTCKCVPGHSGNDCSEDSVGLEKWKSNWCQKNCVYGFCEWDKEENLWPICRCYEGFQGYKCDEVTNKCLYGGSLNEEGKCKCLFYYAGDKCQEYKSCWTGCENDGHCMVGGRRSSHPLDLFFTCSCKEHTSGQFCEMTTEPVITTTTTTTMTTPSTTTTTTTPSTTTTATTPSTTTTTTTPSTTTTTTTPSTTTTTTTPSTTTTTTTTTTTETVTESIKPPPKNQNEMTVEEGKEVIFENITNEEATDIVDEFTLDPSMVKDIIPFLIGGYPEDVRLSLSWTKEEMFLWAAYEDRKLNLEVDFVKFNDKALGNCFTFNHENSSTIYKSRRLGHRGGLQVMTKSISEEYVSWTVPSGIMIFVHDRHESVVSDSPRTNARGGFGTILSVKPSHYKRLGGRYGTCVRNTADVKSYYFLGSYTMDGCLRSCYQDSAQTMCGCMDPRYPMASTSINCPLAQRWSNTADIYLLMVYV